MTGRIGDGPRYAPTADLPAASKAAEAWLRKHADCRDEKGRGLCLSAAQMAAPPAEWVRVRDRLTAAMWPPPEPLGQLALFDEGGP